MHCCYLWRSHELPCRRDVRNCQLKREFEWLVPVSQYVVAGCQRILIIHLLKVDLFWTITVGADVRESQYQLWSRITVATSVKDVLLSSFWLVSPDKLVGSEVLNYPQHHNVRMVTTLPKRVFYRVESSSRKHWPTLIHILRTVSVEFCVQQRIVVVEEVLAACFAGFLLLLVFLVLKGLYLICWVKLHENVQYYC